MATVTISAFGNEGDGLTVRVRVDELPFADALDEARIQAVKAFQQISEDESPIVLLDDIDPD